MMVYSLFEPIEDGGKIAMKIGANIAYFRGQANMTQDSLSKKIGISVPTIARWERNLFQPRASDITKLCSVLICTEAELLNGPADEGYKVILKYVHKIEEAQEKMTINGCGAVTLADDGTIVASHKGKISSLADKEEVLSGLSEKLDEALETVKRRAERAKEKDAQ
jgi:transcriptional regulator with XRE-family HTH domain